MGRSPPLSPGPLPVPVLFPEPEAGATSGIGAIVPFAVPGIAEPALEVPPDPNEELALAVPAGHCAGPAFGMTALTTEVCSAQVKLDADPSHSFWIASLALVGQSTSSLQKISFAARRVCRVHFVSYPALPPPPSPAPCLDTFS